jgi:GNAT superfamily N-acetyltransferase
MAGATELVELASRVERAEAEQLARTGPPGRQAARELAGGLAIWKGPGSPYNAVLGAGLRGGVGSDEVDEIERHLAGGRVRFEVASPAHPSLLEELARRGYRLERLLLVWARAPAYSPPAAGGLEVRELHAGEELAWVEVFAQAFLGRSPGAAAEEASLLAVTSAEGTRCFLALDRGAPAGVALASSHGDVAILSGAGVLPAHRGRGLQLALVRARLSWAAEQGLEVAAAATAAGTASQRTLEKAGFRCAYPKAVLVREV